MEKNKNSVFGRTLKSPELYRNMGFWDEETQQALIDSEVAIAGTGGAGYLFPLELARLGVTRFVIADPEDFDKPNVNRVMGARVDTIGKNKSEVLKEEILSINPEAKVRIYNKGITVDNIKEFLSTANVVLNAVELTMPHLGTMLCREARNRKINNKLSPVPVMDIEYIGHGGQVTSFDPYSKYTFEKIMGLDENESLEDISKKSIDSSRYVAYVPPYYDVNTFLSINKGGPLPSNMLGAGVAAQLGVAEYIKHIRVQAGLKTLKPIYAPRFRWYDAYTGKQGKTRFPLIRYYIGVAYVTLKNYLKLNEKSSYSPEERAARGDID